ncbi:O-unit flippase-like protein [Maribacter sp. MAR_2009_72]|uniref:O-unit flippase-like protein n=1 Tax=Maribacter sp. MAR_2009_72 TaxID=1250050 RepID=UPI00119B6101|nr:O-unit flippase-like protein [Maribacter sp. MAR_2009_72]TVZ16938.1 hypothetical protein JM81_3210 [Maribacter sp. MAR_2009_72]
MNITKKDVLWNYAATFLRIASSALLFPFILKMMPAEMVGIWTIFITITAFAALLDFGFNPSFARNVSYIFSGVKNLHVEGFEKNTEQNVIIDYGLLKGIIFSMKWFYSRIAIALFFLLITFGTYYIYSLMDNYTGDKLEVYIAWSLLCLITTYNLYTLYYDSLLQGSGLIKKSKQIIIIGQLIYLLIAVIFILMGYGLIAIVMAQLVSVIIKRYLSYIHFFNKEMKNHIKIAVTRDKTKILKAITPNALKIGLTSFGGFLVSKSAIIIGSLYITLEEIASYGISVQIVGIVAGLGGIYTSTFIPKISQLRILQNYKKIKQIYIRGQFILVLTYIIIGFFILVLGSWFLNLIGSQTQLLRFELLILLLFLSLVETNLTIAGNILLTLNKVPFFKASLISGIFITIGLLITFNITDLGILSMILVPLIVNLCYQGWKWPLEVKKDLKISFSDLF